MGYQIDCIKFKWIGFNINYKNEFILPLHDVLISFSGPLANLLFLIIFKFIYPNKIMFKVNLVLFTFNMLPFNFSDGGRILKIILKYYVGFYRSFLIVNISSIIFSSILFILATINIKKINYILVMILCIYIIIESMLDYKNRIIYVLKDMYLKNYLLKNKKVIKIKLKGVQFNNKILDIIQSFCFNNYYVIYVFKNSNLLGKVTEYDIVHFFQMYGNITLEELINIQNRRN
ncbi:hypothetical protein [Thermobrachium celere]|uniref:hypothetical protein n=1 Tax=Thermobrachium celere TaxID=53422 RepID=UPI001A98D1D4|nr:hypothetical protein [Thermobrachium celere]